VRGGQPVLRPGTAGRALAAGVLPPDADELDDRLLLAGSFHYVTDEDEREAVMYKPRWGAFYETPLHAHLRGSAASTLVFAGCNFPNCPRTSIYEASERDCRIVVAGDAMSGLYERGMDELRAIGVRVMTVAEIIAALPLPE
jgi:nicotinamidase-related amidase